VRLIFTFGFGNKILSQPYSHLNYHVIPESRSNKNFHTN